MTNNRCSNDRTIYLVLDNIRSVHNVGSIFRTAETLGISRIYCVGTTPAPLDRFNMKRKDLAKVSLGAEDLVGWKYVADVVVLVKKLKKDGFQIIALEQAENSIDYKKVKVGSIGGNSGKGGKGGKNDKVAIILGNEVDGVSKSLLKWSDIIAEIPMRGEKESLNVSVSAGIFLYRLLDK